MSEGGFRLHLTEPAAWRMMGWVRHLSCGVDDTCAPEVNECFLSSHDGAVEMVHWCLGVITIAGQCSAAPESHDARSRS